ncbi:tRNA epoxyqueuosine(34) reductase QueG [Candidatus Peregrinibacteria bacterium CG_4_10_14_0_2_um_filter_43_11]|nr:MAG: tRNA epoxyqueuosine(34) reductase QueG [Candidatus Peregrinibacteria bacterium CG_4_10_14_0_2_um_filter_43_11]
MTFELLKTFIDDQGWNFFGITDFSFLHFNLKKHKKIFELWTQRGFQADMNYLEQMEEDRFHPENKLPNIKSVLVLGAWYGGNSNSNSLVARYARGKDYHNVLKKKCVALSDWLKKQYPEAETYISIDSGPTADRVFAETAGLGFFGKNSCLIRPSHGSYFFIASVMTNLDLPLISTSASKMPICGDCQNCLKNCPTGALVSPGVVDANCCISYLTIENKQGIPIALRSKIGNHLFGCDACQEVCPFNQGRKDKQVITIDSLKSENGVGESLDLIEIFSLSTDEDFTKRFAGTPLMRAKRRGLLRNACVVAGNSGDVSLIPHLQSVIDREDDTMIKEHARWAIEQLENQA